VIVGLALSAINQNLHVTAQQNSNAECQGSKSNVTTRLDGQFVGTRSAPTLELSGTERTCPTLGCEFKLTYRVTRK
jgi:hypothetical protein